MNLCSGFFFFHSLVKRMTESSPAARINAQCNGIHLINRIVVSIYFFVDNLNVDQFEWIFHYRTKIYPRPAAYRSSAHSLVRPLSFFPFLFTFCALHWFSYLFLFSLFRTFAECVQVVFLFRNLLIQVNFHRNSVSSRITICLFELCWK